MVSTDKGKEKKEQELEQARLETGRRNFGWHCQDRPH